MSRAISACNLASPRSNCGSESCFISSRVNTASVTAFAGAFLLLTHFKLLYEDWRGLVISFFALVWIANAYMAAFANIRLDIHERVQIQAKDLDVQSKAQELKGRAA